MYIVYIHSFVVLFLYTSICTYHTIYAHEPSVKLVNLKVTFLKPYAKIQYTNQKNIYLPGTYYEIRGSDLKKLEAEASDLFNFWSLQGVQFLCSNEKAQDILCNRYTCFYKEDIKDIYTTLALKQTIVTTCCLAWIYCVRDYIVS